MDEGLLSRVEDAGINASAPPQQRWLDGWLVRYNPGKAKRARCINAVAMGRLTVEVKLHLADPKVLVCGQVAREGDLVGLYDVATAPDSRNKGLATLLCERLLSVSCSQGAKLAYLQVEAGNTPARHLYTRLGFQDGYAYHYRVAP